MNLHEFFMKRGKIILFLVVVLLGAFWLGRTSNDGGGWCPWCVSSATAPSVSGGRDAYGSVALSESEGYSKDFASNAVGTTQVLADDASANTLENRKIVKNGSLSILSEDAADAAEQIQNIATQFGGFTTDARVYDVTSDTQGATVAVKVPAEKFSDAFAAMKEVGVKVQSEQIGVNDVTQQYIDVEARLKNLQAEEAQYAKILERAQTVDEILNVTKRINETRTKIDTTQKQLEYLQKQVAMSTISVSITAEADVTVFGIRWKPLTVVKQAVRDLLNGLVKYVNTIVGFVIQLPLILLWLLTFGLGVWVLWRIVRKVWRYIAPRKKE